MMGEPQMTWIDAQGTELPHDLQSVLVYTDAHEVTLGMMHDGEWVIEFPHWDSPLDEEAEVLYWMPLPTAPQISKQTPPMPTLMNGYDRPDGSEFS